MKKKFLLGFLLHFIPLIVFSQVNIELVDGHFLINGVELSVDPKLTEIQERITSPREDWDGYFYSKTKKNSKILGFIYKDEGIRVARYLASNSNNYIIPERLELFILFQKPSSGPKKTFTGSLKINGIMINQTFTEADLASLNCKPGSSQFTSDLISVHFKFNGKPQTISEVSFEFWPVPLVLSSPLARGDFLVTLLKKYVTDNPNGKYATQANAKLDSMSVIESRISKIETGMTMEDLYEFMQKFLGYPDQKLIAEGRSKYAVDQARFMMINTVKEAKPDEKVTIKFQAYEFIFMNGKLLEYPASFK